MLLGLLVCVAMGSHYRQVVTNGEGDRRSDKYRILVYLQNKKQACERCRRLYLSNVVRIVRDQQAGCTVSRPLEKCRVEDP